MSTRSVARHRKATRPVTPLSVAAPTARRGLGVAAASGLALSVLASGAVAANSTEVGSSAGTLGAAGLAADAQQAVTTNAEISVAEDAAWSEESVDAATAEAPVVEEVVEEVAETTTATTETTAAATTTEAATSTGTTTVAVSSDSSTGATIASIALQYVGSAYVYGASGPTSFDCSGLVQYVYAQVGISLPRTSYAQGSSGTVVSASEAQAGDIVYYGSHVGIYIGNGMMVDAGSTSTGVVYRAVYGSPVYVRVV